MNIHSIKTVKQRFSGISFLEWFPISSILLLATGLYFFRLEAEGLWIDEFNSLLDIEDGRGLPPNNLIRPLYYVLLKGWASLGYSDAWLRSLSILFAIASVFLIYRLGRRLSSEGVGLLSALFLAISPIFINHAQEVRMYAMSTCLGLAGTLALTHALLTEPSKGPSHRILARWAGLRLLAFLTVPLNVTLLVPDVLIFGLRFRQHRAILIRFGTWLLILLTVWAPCFLRAAEASSPSGNFASHHVGRTSPGLSNAVRILKFLTVWPFEVQTNAIFAGFYKLFTVMVTGILGAALIQKHKSSQLFWLAAWFALPLVPIFIFSQFSTSLWVNRYLLFVLPYLLILLAAGLYRLWQQWKIAAVVVSCLYLVAASGGIFRYYTVQDRSDFKFIIQTIAQYEEPGDAIVWGHFYKVSLPHYYDGSSEVHILNSESITTPAEVEKWLSDFPDAPSRLWVTFKIPDQDYPMFQSAIEAKYQIEKVFTYAKNSKVLLLTAP